MSDEYNEIQLYTSVMRFIMSRSVRERAFLVRMLIKAVTVTKK